MMTLNILPPPTDARLAGTFATKSPLATLRLRYESSEKDSAASQRPHLIWLLSESPDEETDYRRIFAALERNSRREMRQPLLVDLRRHRFTYRTVVAEESATAGTLIHQSFSHQVLCIQLAHYLLAELHDNLATDDYFTTSLAGNLTACLIKLLGQSSEEEVSMTPYQIRQIEDYTQAHMDRLVTLDELAQVAKLSPFHFTRQFKRATGETPYQYVVRLKMQHAKAQLLESEASVINIGMQVGYENSSHFSRAFKRTMGVSPTQLRKTLRKEHQKLSA